MTKNGLLALTIVLGFILSTAPASAHHSLAGYDQTTLVPIKGSITNIDWTNPHCWITLAVQNPGGSTTMQRVQIAAPGALTKKGLTKDLLHIGDIITLESWISNNTTLAPPPTGRWMIFSDGRRFDVGDMFGNNPNRQNQR